MKEEYITLAGSGESPLDATTSLEDAVTRFMAAHEWFEFVGGVCVFQVYGELGSFFKAYQAVTVETR